MRPGRKSREMDVGTYEHDSQSNSGSDSADYRSTEDAAHVLSRLVMAAYVGKAEDLDVKPRAEAE